ncbi:MAG: tetratricopeptide repeat protein [Gemmatimonadota bacterium]|nr:tetratricopeptide repeat protein [Gemmatimonadota bacterium]
MLRIRALPGTALIGLLLFTSCATEPGSRESALPTGVEAISLLGDTLRAPPLDSAVAAQREEALATARSALAVTPDDADSVIWLGRRLAYLGRYREAIDIYTQGVATHPDDARLYRHRGHRYITTRQFELAVGDLVRASGLVAGQPDRVEPDGIPNALGIPTSTLHTNVWYHLGLAHYLRGDFERAASAYRECLRAAANPDMTVATSHWLYMTLRRLGRADEAAAVLDPIRADWDVIENHEYHRLLLMYKGELDPDSLLDDAAAADGIGSATTAYGVANWHYYNGRDARASQLFRTILEGAQWPAFGYVAAEAEVARVSDR